MESAPWLKTETFAPGWPGIAGRWTSSAKSGVGTAASRDSRVWFTLSHGILDEVYYPRVDHACTRDLGFIVTDGQTFFSEEKRTYPLGDDASGSGVPAYLIRNTDVDGRYRIEKEVLTDPRRDVVLQRVRFVPLQGTLADFRLYVLLAPHLANRASGNTAWVGDYKGTPMLFAERESSALALASLDAVAGPIGRIRRVLRWVAGTARQQAAAPDLRARRERQRRRHWRGRSRARRTACSCSPSASVPRRWRPVSTPSSVSWTTSTTTKAEYVRALEGLAHIARRPARRATRRVARCIDLSAAVLRTHESKRVEGGVIASLSIPWGFSKGDDDLGGYHLIWPRDLVETATGFLAVGARHEARRVLRYLQVTQEADGHWTQNMWLDGTPYWHGIQMDETALPILLVDLAAREGVLDARERDACWPMVRRPPRFSPAMVR